MSLKEVQRKRDDWEKRLFKKKLRSATEHATIRPPIFLAGGFATVVVSTANYLPITDVGYCPCLVDVWLMQLLNVREALCFEPRKGDHSLQIGLQVYKQTGGRLWLFVLSKLNKKYSITLWFFFAACYGKVLELPKLWGPNILTVELNCRLSQVKRGVKRSDEL